MKPFGEPMLAAIFGILASGCCLAVQPVQSAARSAPQAMTMPMSKPAAAATPAKSGTTTVVPAAVRVEEAWVRAAPPGATMWAGYMTLHNTGKNPARFEWAQSDAFGMIELHRSMTVNGMETMRPAGAQTIPAGGNLRFEPSGLHLMLMDPRRALRVGDVVRFRLHFADGSFVDTTAPVRVYSPTLK
jgi:copper(I)-binding protein